MGVLQPGVDEEEQGALLAKHHAYDQEIQRRTFQRALPRYACAEAGLTPPLLARAQVSGWVTTEIVKQDNLKTRIKVLSKFVEVAEVRAAPAASAHHSQVAAGLYSCCRNAETTTTSTP